MNLHPEKWIVALAVTVLPALAIAHGRLVQATPAAGGTVAPPVTAVTAVFSEALEPAFSNMAVTGPGGKAVTANKAKVDANDPKQLDLAVPPLATGQYKVNWSVVTHDGHRTKGSYAFTVK